jgi:fatty-acyl-CoA synthase
MNPSDQPVGPGEAGEICVQGPLVMEGYWKQPEQTSQALRSGWLHTGDVGIADDEGYITIVDRLKDMIISGGFNVYPREVEDVLTQHPAVAAAAVIGVPDERWGEAVTACVVLKASARAEAAELIKFVKTRKDSMHAPKAVHFVDSIPLTPVGKADKKVLRQRFWAGQERAVH